MEMETFFTAGEQFRIFLLSCVGGALLGVVYDVFRTLRIMLPHGRAAVFAEDCVFFVVWALQLMLFTLVFARGELRLYMALGNGAGFLIYIASVGRIVVEVMLKIRRFITWLLRILLTPICKTHKKLKEKLCRYPKIRNNEENKEKALDL